MCPELYKCSLLASLTPPWNFYLVHFVIPIAQKHNLRFPVVVCCTYGHGSSQGVGPDPKPGLFTALLNPPLISELASGLVACGCPSHPAVHPTHPQPTPSLRWCQPQPTPSLRWCHHGGPLSRPPSAHSLTELVPASARCLTVVVPPWWASVPFTSSSLRVTSVGILPDLSVDKMKGDLERYAL